MHLRAEGDALEARINCGRRFLILYPQFLKMFGVCVYRNFVCPVCQRRGRDMVIMTIRFNDGRIPESRHTRISEAELELVAIDTPAPDESGHGSYSPGAAWSCCATV